MRRTFVCSLLVGLPFIASLRADNDKEAKKIEGTWQLKEAEVAGQKFPPKVAETFRLALEGGKYTLKSNEAPDSGTYKLDPDKKPKQMTITGVEGPNKGKTFLAIYRLKDDTLEVCYDLSGKAHPKDFKTRPKSQLFLAKYKREKS